MYKVKYYTVDKNATGLLKNAACYNDTWYTEISLSLLEQELCRILDNNSGGKYRPVITKIVKINGHF